MKLLSSFAMPKNTEILNSAGEKKKKNHQKNPQQHCRTNSHQTALTAPQ